MECPCQNASTSRDLFARSWPVSQYSAGHTRRQDCRSRAQRHSHRTQTMKVLATSAAAERDTSLVRVGEIADVESVEGLRIQLGEDNTPKIEYLVKWKDGADPSWEPVENLADNLLRDFEEKWWTSCREGEEDAIKALLENSRDVLSQCVDSDNRSALHFCAALGKADCCRILCEAGAEVDYPDKDGYTPLHMAVGYSHISTVRVLLEAGANPEIVDTQGRNVLQLVDSIREQMPLNPQLAGKRVALEEVSALLTGNLFEEVFPKRILEARSLPTGGKEYLVQWLDGQEDSWVRESDVSNDVIEDYERGFEYAEAGSLLKMKMRGDQRLYLVSWLDGRPNSWEFEDHISGALVAAFDRAKAGEDPQAHLPEVDEARQPISKRAARRARKAARRAAAENGAEAEGNLTSDTGPEASALQTLEEAHSNGAQRREALAKEVARV